MKIKDRIRGMIHEAVENFDFEEALTDALDNINIEQLVESKLSAKVEEIDIESMMESLIKDYIDDELDDLDIEEEVLSALQDNFD